MVFGVGFGVGFGVSAGVGVAVGFSSVQPMINRASTMTAIIPKYLTFSLISVPRLTNESDQILIFRIKTQFTKTY